MFSILLHVLDEKLAVALYGIERRSQVVAEPAMEFFGRFALLWPADESWMRLFTKAFNWTLALRIRSRSANRLSDCEPRASR